MAIMRAEGVTGCALGIGRAVHVHGGRFMA